MTTVLALLLIWLILFVCAPVAVFVLTIIGGAIAVIVWDINRRK